MANPILPATGTKVQCDTLADGSQVQSMKLLDGTAGSTAPVGADVTDGLKVQTTAKRNATAAITTLAAQNTDQVVLAASAARKGASIFNNTDVVLYIKLGAVATAASFSAKLNPGDYYELPFNYSGSIHGIFASVPGSGQANVTEIS